MENNASLSEKGIVEPRRRGHVPVLEQDEQVTFSGTEQLHQQHDNDTHIHIHAMLSPKADVVNSLSGLSLEQLSSIEAMIHQAKLNVQESSRAKETKGNSRTLSLDTTARGSTTASMQQFMTVFGSTSRKTPPDTAPSIEYADGIPWLRFGYSTKSFRETYMVRVDIDTVTVECIPLEVQQANCIYPSANGPENEYKGTRREYERECNTQGWKLAHLNPSILGGRKGILQRAVISLRNATSDQKSRRAKRHEKALQRDVQPPRGRGPVMAIPRMRASQAVQTISRELGGGQEHAHRFTAIRWQPLEIVSSHRQIPHSLTVSNTQAPSSAPVSSSQGSSTSQQKRPLLNSMVDSTPQHKPPILGVFQPAHASLDTSSYLEFNGYIHGEFRTLRIKTNVEQVCVDRLTLDFKKDNCVYPRSFSANEQEPSSWNTVGIRQAEECYLNDIGWKLCSLNKNLLLGRRLLLQQALNAYRRHYLPITCQPRARIGPSLLTRRHSVSNGAATDSARSDPRRSQQRSKHSRVRFDINDEGQATSTDSLSKQAGGSDTDVSTQDTAIHGDEETAESEDSEDTEDNTSEDESDDGFSSEDVFHSQMSLLSFTGNIRTYSLGTGSGSARSRPRLDPAESQSRLQSPPRTTISRKRSLAVEQAEKVSHSHSGKRARRERAGMGERALDSDDTENEGSEQEEGQREEVAAQSYDEDEDNWWMSRLNNSEYPEDHNFVSMTTEELIGALTSGYNSDIGDEDDDDDDDDDDGESEFGQTDFEGI
ncbi:hypothetical protein BGZ68_008606 [Mortierella alpina]|nr:hypothetical protein BGZ68_008606 [Mortierella alpina]